MKLQIVLVNMNLSYWEYFNMKPYLQRQRNLSVNVDNGDKYKHANINFDGENIAKVISNIVMIVDINVIVIVEYVII